MDAAFSQIRDDGFQGLVDLGGIENHKVVEHSRKRRHRSDRRFFEQGGAGRIVVVIESKDAAAFLCGRGRSSQQREAQQCDGAQFDLPKGLYFL